MISNLKTLGLALVAALAMTAIAASAAHAEGVFTAEKYPTTVSAKAENSIGSEGEYFEAIGRKIECEVIHYHGAITEVETELEVEPTYTDHTKGGNCRASSALVVTITTNGCKYIYYKITYDPAPADYTANTTVNCPPGKKIVKHVRNLLNTADACTITIDTQLAKGTLTGKQVTKGIAFSGKETIKSTIHSQNTAICGLESGTSKEVETNYVTNNPITLEGAGGEIALSGE